MRKTLTILSLIGLVLSIAAWGASYLNIIYFKGYLNLAGTYSLQDGTFSTWVELPGKKFQSGGGFGRPVFTGWHTTWWPALPWYVRGDYPGAYFFIAPLWIPTLLFAGVLGYRLLPLHRRRRRRKLGLCVKCGYDLRGSSERCPECGQGFSN